MNTIKWLYVAVLLIQFSAVGVGAAETTTNGFWHSVHPVYQFSWANSKERLDYQSCGCADNCWTAKIYDTSVRKERLKLELHCDCESMHLSIAGGKPIKYLDSCAAFQGENKNEAIQDEIRKIQSCYIIK